MSLKKGKFLCEELVHQHPDMSIYNKSSVNTIRCITFRTNKGIIVPFCFMRVGREGSFVDNGGAGGIIIGVNPNTGILNSDGYDEYNKRYEYHPDTHIRFKVAKYPIGTL